MPDAHPRRRGRQVVGDLTVHVTRNADGEVGWDIVPYDTTDPVGLTVAFIELVCAIVPKQPNLLFHVAGACQSREHIREILKQLSDEARATLGDYLERTEGRDDSQADEVDE